MSERELHRIEILSEVVEGRRTLASAAIVLSLSVRQVQRIVRTFCLEGAPALRHQSRGRRSNNRIKRTGKPGFVLVRGDGGGRDLPCP
jgi:hypothetical protein